MITLTTLSLTGKKVRDFLQSYTTADWALTSPAVQWTAFLNNQGRVVTFCALKLVEPDRVLCLLPSNNVVNLTQHLQPYLPFSRIQLALSEELLVCKWSIDSPTPWITFDHSGLYTVHDLSLDQLGYVSFKKGCYLGQEIVARVHARVSDHKKRLALLPVEQLPTTITPLYTQEDRCLAVIAKDSCDGLILHQVWDNSPQQ